MSPTFESYEKIVLAVKHHAKATGVMLIVFPKDRDSECFGYLDPEEVADHARKLQDAANRLLIVKKNLDSLPPGQTEFNLEVPV